MNFVQLKIRWRASFDVRGGFDSVALSDELTQSLAAAQRNAPRGLSWPGGVSRGLLFPLLSPPAPFIVRPVRVRLAWAREPGLEPPSPAATPRSRGDWLASDARRLGLAGCLLARLGGLEAALGEEAVGARHVSTLAEAIDDALISTRRGPQDGRYGERMPAGTGTGGGQG